VRGGIFERQIRVPPSRWLRVRCPARDTEGEKPEGSMRKHIMLGAPVLIAVLAGSAVGVNATDDTDPDDTELDGLVTEEVEPGVERIISDDAGRPRRDTPDVPL
jgi:hypothetical protein